MHSFPSFCSPLKCFLFYFHPYTTQPAIGTNHIVCTDTYESKWKVVMTLIWNEVAWPREALTLATVLSRILKALIKVLLKYTLCCCSFIPCVCVCVTKGFKHTLLQAYRLLLQDHGQRRGLTVFRTLDSSTGFTHDAHSLSWSVWYSNYHSYCNVAITLISSSCSPVNWHPLSCNVAKVFASLGSLELIPPECERTKIARCPAFVL